MLLIFYPDIHLVDVFSVWAVPSACLQSVLKGILLFFPLHYVCHSLLLIRIWHQYSVFSISWALQRPPAESKLLSGYRLSTIFTHGKGELDVPKCWGRTKTSWWILEGRVKKPAVCVNHRLWVLEREWACLDSSVAVWLSKSHSPRTTNVSDSLSTEVSICTLWKCKSGTLEPCTPLRQCVSKIHYRLVGQK